jgi:integrase/recombinase XerD
LNRGPESPSLGAFSKFCIVDLQLTKNTAKLHERLIERHLDVINKDPRTVTQEDLRTYLMTIKENMAHSTYKNNLASLKRYYRDFLGMQGLVESFKFPEIAFKPIKVPSKAELQSFFKALQSSRARALFLIYATSGLRKSEVLSLKTFRDIDFQNRMLTPLKDGNQSKHVWVSFYNEEAEKEVKKYLTSRKDSDPRLFPTSARHVLRIFKRARISTGLTITPQKLRDWFCSEMGSLGVPDRYVDAFCGRVPKSVLARHYTDFSPEKLKQIYDKAGLKVLG